MWTYTYGKNTTERLTVWPMPQMVSMFEEKVSIHTPLEFDVNIKNDIIEEAIKRYRQIIFQHRTDTQVELSQSVQKVIIFIKNDDQTSKEPAMSLNTDEHYELIIHNPKNKCHEILITSPTTIGALRGLETLSQLIEFSFDDDIYQVPIGIIKDFPRFKHRGILLDTARHFHPVQVLKHFLLSLSFAKFNVFHWHIVDQESFPIESKIYPKLWQGAYSKHEKYSFNDVSDVINYARLLGIRVIPEFDTPGHAKSWCAGYPQLCIDFTCHGPFPTVLDPTSNETFTFVENLFMEMTDIKNNLFNDEFFHLGSDEVNHQCYLQIEKVKTWMQKENIQQSKDIYGYFVQRTQKIVINKLKKRPIVWNEVWDNFKGKLPNETVIQLWQGRKKERKSVIQDGHSFLVSYGWYLDHLGNSFEGMYHNDPADGLTDEEKKFSMGGEAAMWSETVDFSNLDATVWPKAGATAERLWSNENVTNVDDAIERLKYFRCLLIRRGIGAAPTLNHQSRQAPPKQDSCFRQRLTRVI